MDLARAQPRAGVVPADGNTHMWILGDSGTETEEFMGRPSHRGEARAVMAVYVAADLSAERGEPVVLPRNDPGAIAAQ